MKNEVKDEFVDKVINLLETENLSPKEIRRVLGSAYGKMLKEVKNKE